MKGGRNGRREGGREGGRQERKIREKWRERGQMMDGWTGFVLRYSSLIMSAKL